MPLSSFSLARLLGLSALFLGLSLGCGGGELKPPSPPPVAPDASRSSVAVDRATGARADGAEMVTITVTVRDGAGNPVSGRAVHVEVSGEGNTVTQPAAATNASGVATASVVSTQPGAKQVTATVDAEGGAVVLGERPVTTFANAPAVKLAFLAGSLSATAGEPVAPVVEVAVQDRLGRAVPGATNEVSILLAEGPSSAELEGTLTAQPVNGVARFPQVVLKQAGSGYRLKATSSGLEDATSASFEVLPALPASLVLAVPATATAGGPVRATVTVRDSFGNLATNYQGTVRFTSTSPGATLPADYAFTAADHGSQSFSVTLSKAGSWEVQAQDTGTSTLAFKVAVSVQPAAASQFVLTSPPGPFKAGEEFSVEVLARDAFGNDATGYLGTIHVTSPDPSAGLPEDYTFTAADEGRHSFNVVLKTAANPQQLLVRDTSVPTLSAILGREIVPAALSQLRFVTQPAEGLVSQPLHVVQVALTDAFGNRVHVSSPGVMVTLKGGNPAAMLSGTVLRGPVDGLATFSELRVTQEGTGFQLSAAAGSLAPVESSSFDVIDDVPPDAVALTSTGATPTRVSLAWKAVGDDGSLGTAARYEVRYATSRIEGPEEFAAATLAISGTPQPAQSAEAFTVTGLTPGTTYHFAIRVWDSVDNASPLAVVSASTPDPCSQIVCEVPEPTCAADGVTRVTFTSACVVVDDLPTCQDTEVPALCPGEEGVCFAGACGTADRPQPGELTFTEVMHSPSVGTTPYFELHNPTQKLLNIAGLRIDNDAASGFATFTVDSPYPGGAVLVAPGGWFVVAQLDRFDLNGGVPVDYALGSSFELGGDGHLTLRTASGTVIEDFAWSSSFPQTPGRAMNLAATVVDTPARERPWYWCDSSVNARLIGGDYGTPGQPNDACGMSVGSAPAFCNIQFPKTFPDPYDPWVYPAVIPYGSRKTIYTQFSGMSLTDRNLSGNDEYPHVQAELGHGAGADPATWQWSAARLNPFYVPAAPAFDPVKDEEMAWLRIFTPGTYSYGFRYRLYDPVAHSFSGYTYCDQNGVAPDPAAGSYGTVTVGTEPLGPTNHLVISEFAPRGPGDDNDEFIELYNPTSDPVNISGWKVQYMPSGGSTFQELVTLPEDTFIAAHGYYLIAHTGYAGSAAPDLQYAVATSHSGGNIRIGLGTLGIQIVDSATVDNLGWGSAAAPEGDASPAPGSAGCLERKAALLSTAATMEGGTDATRGNGIDSDWNADDFVIRVARDPQGSASPPETP